MRGLADIAVPGTAVFLRDDRQPRDRYKRSLSHPFLADGRNKGTRGAKGGEVAHHIARSAQFTGFACDSHHRNRRFR